MSQLCVKVSETFRELRTYGIDIWLVVYRLRDRLYSGQHIIVAFWNQFLLSYGSTNNSVLKLHYSWLTKVCTKTNRA